MTVSNNLDQCPNTPAGASVNASGCYASQSADGEGWRKAAMMSKTPSGETVSSGLRRAARPDGDGVLFDQCPKHPCGGSRG